MNTPRLASSARRVAGLSLLTMAQTVSFGAYATPIPPGGYQNSCRDIAVAGTELHAACKTFSGDWAPTSVLANFGACKGDIFNLDGALKCAGNNAPGGTYQQTCANVTFDNDSVLSARCKNFGGSYVVSSLNTTACTFNISNIDGHLRCDVAGPQGSYLRTCWNIKVTGNGLTATCRTNDGNSKTTSYNNANGCSSSSDLANTDGTLACSSIKASSGGPCLVGSANCAPPSQPGFPPGGSSPGSPGNPPGPFGIPGPPGPTARTKAIEKATRQSTGTVKVDRQLAPEKPRVDPKSDLEH